MKKYAAITLLISTLFLGCDNAEDKSKANIETGKGVYVLNEGLWGSNNSSISYINTQTGDITNDFPSTNWGHPLGDTGNSFFVSNDTVFVVVNMSNKIEYFKRSTGTWLGSFTFPQNTEPRFGVRASDGFIYVTSFKLGGIVKINPNHFTQDSVFSIGSYPEQIVEANGKLFIGITDLGDGNTIAVFNLNSKSLTKNITVSKNPADIFLSGSTIYVHTTGHWSNPQSKIYKISSTTLTVSDSVSVTQNITTFGKYSQDNFYVITSEGVYITNNTFSLTNKIINADAIKASLIFSAYYDSNAHRLWIASSSSYTTQGWLEAFYNGEKILGAYQTGINPGDILPN